MGRLLTLHLYKSAAPLTQAAALFVSALFCSTCADDSRMRSEGFSFNSGGLEVGVVFAQRCFHDRNRSRHVRNRSRHVRSGVPKPHCWAALTKCDKMICWRSISSLIAWFCCML